MIKNKLSKRQISAIVVLGILLVSMIPILIISYYNVPYFDDFNHGYLTHKVVTEGFDFGAFLSAAFTQVKDMYFNWQGCYSGIFLSAIHLGVFSENLYGIGSILIFVIHIISILYFSYIVFKRIFKLNYCWIIIGGLISFMQIQYLPSVQEGFFWWSGAVMHTLMYDLMIIAIAVIVKQLILKKVNVLNSIFVILLLFVCGGGAYEIALFLPILILAITICYFIFRKMNVKNVDDNRTSLLLIYFFVSLIFLLINVLAPGNTFRIESTGVDVNPIIAVIESFIYSAIYLCAYFSIRTISLAILVFYFIFPIIKKQNFRFVAFKLFTFGMWCLYSVLFTPAIYGENYVASPRYLNILYFASYWFILVEAIYFFYFYKDNKILNNIYDNLKMLIDKLKPLTVAIAMALLMIISVINESHADATSSSAFLDVVLGNAQGHKYYMDNLFDDLNSEEDKVVIEKPHYKVRVFPDHENLDKAIIDAYSRYYDKKIIIAD